MERKKNNFGKRMVAYLLAVLMCICILPISVSAASKIDIGKDVSLKVIYEDGSRKLSDVSFSLYRVAEVNENAKCRLTGDFKKYEDTVSLKNLDAAGWKNTALTLKGYVQRDNVPATRTAKTNASGEFSLENLETGMYLVIGDRTEVGNYIYTAEPILLFLPGRDAVSDEWNYDVSVHAKYDRDHSGGGGGKDDDDTSYKVLKVWKDEGHKKERPNKITVQLLRDGKVYDKVDLTEKNNWRYTWKNLSDKYDWMVVEKEEDNYTVSVSKEGTTFVMTNTYDNPPGENPPGENPPGENPPGEDPPDEDEEDEMVLGDIDEIIPKTEEILPKTGALWWPVPVLACGGLILIMAGCFLKRRQMNEEE